MGETERAAGFQGSMGHPAGKDQVKGSGVPERGQAGDASFGKVGRNGCLSNR